MKLLIELSWSIVAEVDIGHHQKAKANGYIEGDGVVGAVLLWL